MNTAMAAPEALPIAQSKYDHPEHYRDQICAHCTSDRTIPSHLQDLLLEQAGHRCTICREPRYEIHHIRELGKGGTTEYDNLIVLCPNCHARVHSEGIPSEKELRHYKFKEEVAYGLPVLSRLTTLEVEFVRRVAALPIEEIIVFLERHHAEVAAEDHEEAKRSLRRKVGFLYLEQEGIIRSEYESSIGLEKGRISAALHIRVTDKGVRWLQYLSRTGRLALLDLEPVRPLE